MPVPKNAPIEGYPHPGSGDRHVLVLDRDNCSLYELYSSHLMKNGDWKAGSGAVWIWRTMKPGRTRDFGGCSRTTDFFGAGAL